MGKIIKYKCKCKCGYETNELNIGSGMMGCNSRIAEKLFGNEWERYVNEKNNGIAIGFIIENVIVFCENCNEYKSVISLLIEKTNGSSERIVKSECPDCNGEKLIYNEQNLKCPMCNNNMECFDVGIWD